MDNNQIRPEWVPSAYQDQSNNTSIVEISWVKHSLYQRKAVAKYGLKRKQITKKPGHYKSE